MDDSNGSTHDIQQATPTSASTEPRGASDTLQSNDVIELQAFLEVCFPAVCHTCLVFWFTFLFHSASHGLTPKYTCVLFPQVFCSIISSPFRMILPIAVGIAHTC